MPPSLTRGHFQPDRKKTKAEVMAEVIAKSKEHKVCLSSIVSPIPLTRLSI